MRPRSDSGEKALHKVLREQGLFILVCPVCLRDWLVQWGSRCPRCGTIQPEMGRPMLMVRPRQTGIVVWARRDIHRSAARMMGTPQAELRRN